MFNVLLIVAGVLEYVLLGIDFAVSTFLSRYLTNSLTTIKHAGQFPEYIPRRNPDLGRVH